MFMLGGLEEVGGYVGGGWEVPFPSGRYQVNVHLIDWKSNTLPSARIDSGSTFRDASVV
jgi:hypothetical protein